MKANVRLRRERELRAWSQAKVAEEIGTDPATVSRWERGLSFPYPYFRERLCALFKKSPEELGLVQGQDQETSRSPLAASDYFYESVTHTFLHDPAVPLLSVLDGSLVGRDELLLDLKEQLFSSQILPLVALYGLPGVGKTSIAVQLAHDPRVREHFYDGVLWVSLGPSPTIHSLLTHWSALLGVDAAHIEDNSNIHEWATRLRMAIGSRKMLLIIDDAWRLSEALIFKLGGYNCACLLTSRFPHIALHIAGNNAHEVPELTEADGVTLLERLAPGITAYEPQAVYELVRSVGCLPLALTLMGKYLRAHAYNRQPRRIHLAVMRLLDAQERMQLSEPYAPVDLHTSLTQGSLLSLQSIIAVSDNILSPQEQRVLRMLALFPAKPDSFTEEAALAVIAEGSDVLDTLSDAGLLESRGPGRYMLHQTIYDYARVHSYEIGEAAQRFVAYFVSFVEEHSHNYLLLEEECNNILAALRVAYEQHMKLELERGIISFSVFLEANRHPLAPQVRSWLTS